MSTDTEAFAVNRSFTRLRLPVVVGTLMAIVYYSATVILQPTIGAVTRSEISSPAETPEVLEISPGTPAEQVLIKGDRVPAVNGVPLALRPDWHLLFPYQGAYQLSVNRHGELFEITLWPVSPPVRELANRVILPIIAFLTWGIGAVILLLATPRNREAWRAGFVMLSLGLIFTIVPAVAYRIPAGYTGMVLVPVAAVGFAELGLFPHITTPSRNARNRKFFQLAYLSALVLTCIYVVDIHILRLMGVRLYDLTGFSPLQAIVLFGAVFTLANPLIIVTRYVRLPRSYLKHQLRILMVGIFLAFGPLILLVILPTLMMSGVSLIPYQIAFVFIVLMPAAFAYAILHHKYLGLDVFITQMMALLVTGIGILFLYSLFHLALGRAPELRALEPLPTSLFMLTMVLALPATNRPALHFAQTLLYGRHWTYQRVISGWVAAALARNPELGMLQKVTREIADLLQARQAALFLSDRRSSDLVPIETLQVDVSSIPASAAKITLPQEMVIRTGLDESEIKQHPLLDTFPWVEVIAPIRTGEQIMGLLLLGQRVPDGSFDAYHVAFIADACAAVGITAQTIRLFEGAMALSREQMQIRDRERARISAWIHDDVLQDLSATIMCVTGIVRHTPSTLGPETEQALQGTQEVLKRISKHLRDICFDLRPPVLTEGDVEWLIRDITDRFSTASPAIKVHYRIEAPNELGLSQPATHSIYNVLTEALNNVRRHSGANEVWITFQRADGHLCLSIEDNGQGVALEEMSLADLVRAQHFGIVGMHEQARLINGSLTIGPRRNGGTIVALTYSSD